MDAGFWGGLVPANARDPAALRALLDAGALGLKAFLCPSGARAPASPDRNPDLTPQPSASAARLHALTLTLS